MACRNGTIDKSLENLLWCRMEGVARSMMDVERDLNRHRKVEYGLSPARFQADTGLINLMSVGSCELGPSSPLWVVWGTHSIWNL